MRMVEIMEKMDLEIVSLKHEKGTLEYKLGKTESDLVEIKSQLRDLKK
jgi:hypothetical protein